MANPAREWERFGRVDPYYGVVSAPEFRRDRLDEGARARLLASGEVTVDAALSLAEEVRLGRVLDFGCGVGRVLVPLARRAQHVVGVDVSPSMLEEARRNCERAGVRNVDLITADRLSELGPGFDFVHSSMVFQHMRRRDGERLIPSLTGLLGAGGWAVLHLTTRCVEWRTRLFFSSTRWIPGAGNVWNLIRGRPWSYPRMEMHTYDLRRIYALLERSGVREVRVRLLGPDAGFESVLVAYRRK